MRARPARKASKSLFFIVVASAHALAIAILLSESHSFRLASSKTVPISAELLLPARRRRERFAPGQLHAMSTPSAPITAPITLMLPAVTAPLQVARPVNWARAARQAVGAILRRHKKIAFGVPKRARSRAGLRSGAATVRPGESYRTPTGERVDRISRHCEVESGPPPLDASWLEQHAQMARVHCSGVFTTPQTNLFKHLPAYKRYHTLPRRAVQPRRHAAAPPHPR